MDRGLYIAASGMLAEMVRQEQIANELANSTTPGYKADRSSQSGFGELLLSNTRNGRSIGQVGFGVQIDQISTDLTPAPVHETGDPLDMAIEGEGFFAVQTPAGVRYTRNGQFTSSAAGTLTDAFGNEVLGANGAPVKLRQDGTVSAAEVGAFAVNGARKQGESLFTGTAAGTASGKVRTGALEESATDPARSMVEMISSFRSLESDQKAIQTIDETLGEFAGQVGVGVLTVFEGLYTAAAGMEAQQSHLDALSNDLANVSTVGYKSLRVGFHDLLYQAAGRGAAAGVQTGAGAASGIIGRNFGEGALIPTERSLDVALTGPGFIRVRGANGQEELTRDGNLGVSADGRLRTSTGEYLEPPIRIPNGVDPSEVSIASDGTVEGGARRLGKIDVVEVANPDGLQSVGDSLFRPTAASGATRAANATGVEQGALESSNVDIADATTEMMNAQRGFQLVSKAIQTQDEVLAVANGVKR